MRKAVIIAQKSRRGIPFHWNERFQDKHLEVVSADMRHSYHQKERRKAKQNIVAFRWTDWEDFISLYAKNCISMYDW